MLSLESYYFAEHIDILDDLLSVCFFERTSYSGYPSGTILWSGLDGKMYLESLKLRLHADCSALVSATCRVSNKTSRYHKVCGCIATGFHGAERAESDFLVLRWNKDDFRTSLSDFGLHDAEQACSFLCY